MRHFLETFLFLLGGIALISRPMGSPWWVVLIVQVLISAAYYHTVRPLIEKASDSEKRSSVDIYRNNVGILLMAGVIGIYTPAAFVVGGSLIVISIVIAFRSFKYDEPVKDRGAKILRGF